jgi:uncharacterized surface protein with fasciclin (FAS1) repeats
MSKMNHQRAMMAHRGYSYGRHGYYGHGMPHPYPTGHYGQSKHDKEKNYGAQTTQSVAQAETSIVDVATSAGSFKTLIKAVKAAGLVDTLSGSGPYTVFAPTDEAFAKLPAGTLEDLLSDKDKLTRMLTYHVIPGKLDSSAMRGISKLATVEGSELPVADIKIAKTDVMASNGVIHAIDEVLIPEA